MTAGVFSCILRIFIGTPLGEILFEVKRLEDLCLDYGQMKTLAYIASVEQVCCNLLGISDDPLVLTGNFVDENKLLKEMQTNRRGSAIAVILHLKYFLATYLNDFKSASALYKENKEQFSSAFVSCFRLFQVFYEGISFAGLSRIVSGSCRKRALADVQKRVKALNNFVVQCPENAINKLYLVKAELEFSCGRYTCALLNYSKAIDYAEREGFVCETALACEKAGLMLQKAGKSTEAVEYFRKARSLYLSWGATVKADEISRLLSAN